MDKTKINGLRIDTGLRQDEHDHDDRPKTPGDKKVDSQFITPQSLRRSDTADSLNALVGRSPSLSNVKEIEALPSPLFPNKVQNNLFSRRPNEPDRKILSNSPLSKAAPFEGADEEIHHAPPDRRDTIGVLPPKLFARLQIQNARNVSLNVGQPVSDVEMPRMVRHRSQSQVPMIADAMQLQREPNLGLKDEVISSEVHVKFQREQEVFNLPCDGSEQTFVGVSQLGEGTFSRVILARSQDDPYKLVAVKAVGLLASGTADKSRVEMTVRREIELLAKLKHPLIIKLRGSVVTDTRAYIVLDYCPGGDLFMLASMHRPLLTPFLVRRIFAELVTAVHFLHINNIIHRDLKLENILLRLPPEQLTKANANQLFITLTDLGLAREIDPLRPDVTTRCGSEDYAAPEIVMGQPYDGRQSDAWALGALLYCLLEGRLPFDVIPGLEHKMKTKVLHRICRIEWRWVCMKDSDDDGAKRVVANLLRSRTKRWTVPDVMQDPWLVEELAIVSKLV